VNSFLKALDGWVPSCAFYPVPRRKCKLAAFAKRTIILYFFLRTSSRPEIEVVNHFWARCCGRVAQSRLHSASEKNGAGKALFKTPQFCMIEIAAHQGHKKKSVPGRCGQLRLLFRGNPSGSWFEAAGHPCGSEPLGAATFHLQAVKLGWVTRTGLVFTRTVGISSGSCIWAPSRNSNDRYQRCHHWGSAPKMEVLLLNPLPNSRCDVR